MSVLLDSSAILAFLWDEPGAEQVAAVFGGEDSPSCVVVNWAEVAAKVMAGGGDWDAADALFGRGLELVPVERADAVEAGRLWTRHPQLSLAGRLCLAVASRLGATVLTADREWGRVSPEARLIR
ncbi:MAG: PIN domain-containing protein [Bifidobacteriaceae bacterium]|jgi:PIN domain nuclease of toxin-antitoxin system|nr:PIN domain-containing protein [Bifidobacteriaceae bacterium]